MWFTQINTDRTILEIKHFLKQLIEPEVLSILKQFRNEPYSENGNIAVIVVGGAATDMWLNSSDEKTLGTVSAYESV